MAVKEIKQHWIVSCDCCGASKDQTGMHRPSAWVKINVAQDALDFSGAACADASSELLLCHKCGPKIAKAINVAVENARAALEKSPTPPDLLDTGREG